MHAVCPPLHSRSKEPPAAAIPMLGGGMEAIRPNIFTLMQAFSAQALVLCVQQHTSFFSAIHNNTYYPRRHFFSVCYVNGCRNLVLSHGMH